MLAFSVTTCTRVHCRGAWWSGQMAGDDGHERELGASNAYTYRSF